MFSMNIITMIENNSASCTKKLGMSSRMARRTSGTSLAISADMSPAWCSSNEATDMRPAFFAISSLSNLPDTSSTTMDFPAE